jgi:hypothetical protein
MLKFYEVLSGEDIFVTHTNDPIYAVAEAVSCWRGEGRVYDYIDEAGGYENYLKEIAAVYPCREITREEAETYVKRAMDGDKNVTIWL